MIRSLFTRRGACKNIRRASQRPTIEELENRCLLAALPPVNSTNDLDDGMCNAAHCSLREAINLANSLSGRDTISFNIPATDAGHVYYRDDGVAGRMGQDLIATTTAADDAKIPDIDPDWPHSWWSIVPANGLPALGQPVIIDGYTQTGASRNTLDRGDDAVLRIELAGRIVGGGAQGLQIFAGNTTVRGLIINGFNEGVRMSGQGGNVVEGNFIGTDPTGMIGLGNHYEGLAIAGVGDNRIGGSTPAARNVMMSNTNLFGGRSVIEISGAGASNNRVQGNFIGTNAHGTAALGSIGPGVSVDDGTNNIIGGLTATPGTAPGNVISGNNGNGIAFGGTGSGLGTGNQVLGNIIGLDVTGTVALGNNGTGVGFGNGGNNVVGGTAAGARNIISGNRGGVFISGGFFAHSGDIIQGNYIGTDITGTQKLGNNEGVFVQQAQNILIGGAAAGAGNLISGNGTNGITVTHSAFAVVIQGNRIGTKADGVSPLGNGENAGNGILLESSNNSVIGNTIAFNGREIGQEAGVRVGAGATGNGILGNSIFGNKGLGIDLDVPVGVTPNDPGDADTGPNNLQNYPVLTAAEASNARTSIAGTLDSTANKDFRIEFFVSTSAFCSARSRAFSASSWFVCWSSSCWDWSCSARACDWRRSSSVRIVASRELRTIPRVSASWSRKETWTVVKGLKEASSTTAFTSCWKRMGRTTMWKGRPSPRPDEIRM